MIKSSAYFVIFLLILPKISITQSELTLEKAIFSSEMRPQKLSGLAFFPDSKKIGFWRGQNFLTQTISSAKSEPQIQFSLLDLNTRLTELGYTSLSTRPAFEIKSNDELLFLHSNQLFLLSISTQKIEVIAEWSEKAENTELSPKFDKIAFTKKNNLYTQIHDRTVEITRYEDPNRLAGQAIARYEFGISKGTFWSNRGNALAFYEKDETAVTTYPLVDLSTIPAQLNPIKYPMAGQGSEIPSVGVFNFETEKLIYLELTGEKDHYVSNLCWGPNDRIIYLTELNRDQDHLTLNAYDAHTGQKINTLFEEFDEQYIQPEHPLYFLPKHPDQFLFFSERSGFNHLYLYSTAGELIKALTSGEWLVDEIVGMDPNGKWIILTGWESGSIDRNLYRIDVKTGKKTQLNQAEGVHKGLISPNGKYLIDTYSSTTVPNRSDVILSSGKFIQPIFKAENPLANYSVGFPFIDTLQSADGDRLFTRLFKPSNFDPNKNYPVVVYVYNGPNVQLITNSWNGSAPLWMNVLAEKGYLVFTLDGRGSNNRGIEFEQAVFGQLGQLEMKDQLTGVDYLKSLPYVDSDKMAIHGWSYGGFMTLSLMVNYPDVFKVGVAGGPVTDWSMYEVMYGERYMDTPQKNPEGYDLTRVYDKTDQLKGDVLIIHGSADPTVVMQHSELFLKDAIKNQKPIDFFMYPGYKHNVRGKDRIHLMKKVFQYINQKLNTSTN